MESLMTWGLELHHFSTFQRLETTYETFSERCIFDSDYRLKVDVHFNLIFVIVCEFF